MEAREGMANLSVSSLRRLGLFSRAIVRRLELLGHCNLFTPSYPNNARGSLNRIVESIKHGPRLVDKNQRPASSRSATKPVRGSARRLTEKSIELRRSLKVSYFYEDVKHILFKNSIISNGIYTSGW